MGPLAIVCISPDHILRRLGLTVIAPGRGLMLALVSVPKFTVLPLLHKLLQLPLPYQLLYLLFEVSTIFYVMAMILVKSAVLILITDVRRRVQWSRPFKVVFVLNLR